MQKNLLNIEHEASKSEKVFFFFKKKKKLAGIFSLSAVHFISAHNPEVQKLGTNHECCRSLLLPTLYSENSIYPLSPIMRRCSSHSFPIFFYFVLLSLLMPESLKVENLHPYKIITYTFFPFHLLMKREQVTLRLWLDILSVGKIDFLL